MALWICNIKNNLSRDLRDENNSYTIKGHKDSINCIDFNYKNSNLFLTGSNDKSIALWDLRNLKIKLHNFKYHTNDVLNIKWNKNCEKLFGSIGKDNSFIIWDINKIGKTQSRVEAEEGPVELKVDYILILVCQKWFFR